MCLLPHTHPLACGGLPHLWHFDPLTVISLSTRKSPGAAGALSLSPDGVSDPADGARREARVAIPAAKQGRGREEGSGERKRRGKRTVTP